MTVTRDSGRPMAGPDAGTRGDMVIFPRDGGRGGRHAADEPRRSGRHAAEGAEPDQSAPQAGHGAERRSRDEGGAERRSRGDRGAERRDAAGGSGTSRPAEVPPADEGPYDIAEAPDDRQRVDLGSLQIPVVEGVEVRVQANSDGIIQQVVLAHADSALQLGAFAAPRSEGI